MGESSAKPRLPHFYIPKDIGPFFDSLVLALFKLSKRSSAGEVLKKDPNLKNEEAVSRGLAYLAYIGVVTRKKGGYELEEKGRQIGVALIENRADQVDLLWRGVLQAHKLHSLVEEYITEEGAGVRGSSIGLGEFIRRKAGEKWKSHFVKEGGKRLAKLFQSKGLVGYDEQDDSIKLSVPAGTVVPPIGSPLGRAAEERETVVKPSLGRPRVAVNINIEIGKDTPAETVDRILTVIETVMKDATE